MKRKKTIPSKGEVAAVGGYWKQYEYSACIIYSLMQAGELDWLSLADPHAGILDDLLLGTEGLVWARQVKTQADAKAVLLNTQLVVHGLAKEISDSWLSLESLHGVGKVRIKYIFGGFFSTSDTALANDHFEGASHSAEFARFLARTDLTVDAIAGSQWSAKLEEIRKLCGLSEEGFVRFLNCLELCGRDELAAHRIESYPPSERPRLLQIQSLIPTLLSGSKPSARWTEDQLVGQLGWRRKPSQRGLHEFPVPGDFQENDKTRDEVLAAIKEHSSGYISLVGPPGTGKSTLLQQALFSNPDYGVARYLAFVPDQRHSLGRAETGEFLNDLTAGLRDLGFAGSRFRSDSLIDLRSELSRQLGEAAERYRDNGRKTVIVIDGLDHVPREETPLDSFLKSLPQVQSIPEGVLFVLGTQHFELPDLNATAKQQAQERGRCIHIEPLSRASVFEMADTAGLPEYVERESLYSACAGHPLTVRYFIEALRGAEGADEAKRILSYTDGIGRSLEEIYERVWKALGARADARKVLALLARADGAVSASELAKTVSTDAVEDVLARARFLLSVSDAGLLSIFHNSFRLFIAGETRKRFGISDESVEGELNAELADLAARVPDDDPQRWMELRYRARAGDGAGVLRLASPEYFRRSLAEYRPYTDILIDLRLTYGAVKPTRSRVILLNKLLIEKELEYRLEAVSQVDFVELFLALGDRERAIKHALDTGFGDGWLELVDVLWEDGEYAVARRVFEANEPLEALYARDGFSVHEHIAGARNWISRAHRFRPVERLVAIVESLPIDARLGDIDSEEWVRKDLLFCLAGGIVRDNLDTDIEDLCARLDLSEADAGQLAIEAARDALDAEAAEDCRRRLSEGAKGPVLEQVAVPWRRLGAFVANRAGDAELAKSFLATLTIPSIIRRRDTFSSSDFSDDCKTAYRLSLLGRALGVDLQREGKAADDFFATLESKLNLLADIGARTKSSSLDGTEIAELRGLVHFLGLAKPDRSQTDGYRFYGIIDWFGEELLNVAHRLGADAFQQVVELIEEKLRQRGNNLYSSESFRLRFAETIFAKDGKIDEAVRRIEDAASISRSGRTPHEAVSSRIDFAKAFANIGRVDLAWQSLDAMHEDTFGYWLRAKKEPQYEFWAYAFVRGCDADAAGAGEYAREFGRFILGMDETEGDETARRVVGDLMLGASHSPGDAAGLLTRLIESDLTTWARLASSTLAGIVRRSPDLTSASVLAFARLVVPFYEVDDDEFIATALTALDEDSRRTAIDSLVAAAERWCPQSRRAGLLDDIIKAAPDQKERLERSLARAQSSAEALPGDSGRSDSGVGLDLNAASLEELLQQGEGKSDYGDGVDYSYARAAEKLAAGWSKEEIRKFLAVRPHVIGDAKFAVACSRAMLRAGEHAFADELFSKAEEAARSGHWSWFLGGQKLELQKLRIEREGNAARERGFDVLVDELASGQTSGTTLFLNLSKVLELVSLELPYKEAWRETEDHLKQYREYRLAAPVTPIGGVRTHAELLAYLIAQAFSFSCPEVLDHARATALAIGALEARAQVLAPLFRYLEGQPDGVRETAALVYRLRSHEALRDVLLEVAQRLAGHDDFIVSNQAERVLRHLGEPKEADPPTKLPAFYELQTSGSSRADDFELAPGQRPGERPVWSDDPWSWTSSQKLSFNVLAKATGLEVEALRRRCAEFMRREGGREAFGPEAEKRIETRLSRVGLRFPWRRALPMSTQRGIGKIIGELVRAQHIDPRVLPVVWPEIGGPSLAGLELPLEPRPEWLTLPDLPQRQYGGIEAEAWLEASEASLFVPTAPGWFVLAERTAFKARMWRESVECIRYSLPHPLDVDEINPDLHGAPRLVSIDDWRPLYDRSKSSMLCIVSDYYFGDLREAALTLCPFLIADMGWVRSRSRPLEVLDRQGTVVARTIRWVDGTYEHDFYQSEMYAEGQAVLLSAEARAAIEGAHGPLGLGTRVVRGVQREGGDAPERDVSVKADGSKD